MGIFTQVDEIENLARRLSSEVTRRFYRVVERRAEELSEELIESKGLQNVCADIDEAIESIEDAIHYDAEIYSTYTYDNYLLVSSIPYSEKKDVEEEYMDVIKERVCGEDFHVDKAINDFAYFIWYTNIRNELRKLLEEKCKKAGLLARVAGLLR